MEYSSVAIATRGAGGHDLCRACNERENDIGFGVHSRAFEVSLLLITQARRGGLSVGLRHAQRTASGTHSLRTRC